MTPEERATKIVWHDSDNWVIDAGPGQGIMVGETALADLIALAIREAVEEAKAQARADEREACAKIPELMARNTMNNVVATYYSEIASAIRARSKEGKE